MRKPTTSMMLALGALFVCTPFFLNASAPRNARSIQASARVTRARLGKVRVAARLDHGAHNRLRVQLTAENPTDQPAVARVRVAVFESRPGSRYARMPSPPMNHGNATLEVRLKPHERLVKIVPITRHGKAVALSKRHVRRSWLAVRPAPMPRKRVVAARVARKRVVAARAAKTLPRPQKVAASH